uniref:Uncharacterized protein n=1 Tax=Trichuris muris TaxID=70415 RepID=A0A5S6R241_TRIMR
MSLFNLCGLSRTIMRQCCPFLESISQLLEEFEGITYAAEPRLGPELSRLVERLYNFLKVRGCWNADRYLVDTEFADVSMPYRTCKRISSREHKELGMRRTMTIEDFIAYLESWTATRSYAYRKNGEHNLLSATADRLMALIPNSNIQTPIGVIFPCTSLAYTTDKFPCCPSAQAIC